MRTNHEACKDLQSRTTGKCRKTPNSDSLYVVSAFFLDEFLRDY